MEAWGTWSTDPLFMRNSSGEYFWYHNDQIGMPQMMTTSSGAVVWKAKYSSFGKAIVDPNSTIVNPLRFPGQYEDEETELHYNYHRYFDSKKGFYISTDPIGMAGGLNLYTYVQNSPMIGIDPTGLMIVDIREFFPREFPNVFPTGDNTHCVMKCWNSKSSVLEKSITILTLVVVGPEILECPQGWALWTLLSTYSNIFDGFTIAECQKICRKDPSSYGPNPLRDAYNRITSPPPPGLHLL